MAMPRQVTHGAASGCRRQHRGSKQRCAGCEEMVRQHVAPPLSWMRKGMARPRNVVTFTSLMDCHSRQGDLAAAELWLRRLMAVGLQPTVVSYGVLLRGYAQLGEVIEAAKSLRRWL